MKLSFEQIKSITAGAARIEEMDGAICFRRFTKAQEDMYLDVKRNLSKDFYEKSFSTSGIKMKFKTNSGVLSLKVFAQRSSSRFFFDHDIYVNGELKYTLSGNLKDGDEVKSKTAEGTYDLGDGEKLVCIYFPWSVDSRLLSLELDDGATVEPVAYAKKMIVFGDSITHGYDATNPSLSYASLIIDHFDADARNKGIGGEIFRPALSAIKDDGFEPDIITVAYGTNDWSGTDKETFDRNSEVFYTDLARIYPNARIISLAPIWRVDYNRTTKVGEFSYIVEKFKEIAEKIPNMTVIDCFNFVPHDPGMYLDLRVHPNNEGFSYYANGIINALEA